MNPFIAKRPRGWFCYPCKLPIEEHQDAKAHGTYVHRIGRDFLAEDPEGNFFDMRGMDLPKILREGGLA